METIQCPKCKWKPDGGAYWSCDTNGCGHRSWDTFETRGKCPGCGKQWETTQCPACGEWSPHKDWYTGDAYRQVKTKQFAQAYGGKAN